MAYSDLISKLQSSGNSGYDGPDSYEKPDILERLDIFRGWPTDNLKPLAAEGDLAAVSIISDRLATEQRWKDNQAKESPTTAIEDLLAYNMPSGDISKPQMPQAPRGMPGANDALANMGPPAGAGGIAPPSYPSPQMAARPQPGMPTGGPPMPPTGIPQGGGPRPMPVMGAKDGGLVRRFHTGGRAQTGHSHDGRTGYSYGDPQERMMDLEPLRESMRWDKERDMYVPKSGRPLRKDPTSPAARSQELYDRRVREQDERNRKKQGAPRGWYTPFGSDKEIPIPEDTSDMILTDQDYRRRNMSGGGLVRGFHTGGQPGHPHPHGLGLRPGGDVRTVESEVYSSDLDNPLYSAEDDRLRRINLGLDAKIPTMAHSPEDPTAAGFIIADDPNAYPNNKPFVPWRNPRDRGFWRDPNTMEKSQPEYPSSSQLMPDTQEMKYGYNNPDDYESFDTGAEDIGFTQRLFRDLGVQGYEHRNKSLFRDTPPKESYWDSDEYKNRKQSRDKYVSGMVDSASEFVGGIGDFISKNIPYTPGYDPGYDADPFKSKDSLDTKEIVKEIRKADAGPDDTGEAIAVSDLQEEAGTYDPESLVNTGGAISISDFPRETEGRGTENDRFVDERNIMLDKVEAMEKTKLGRAKLIAAAVMASHTGGGFVGAVTAGGAAAASSLNESDNAIMNFLDKQAYRDMQSEYYGGVLKGQERGRKSRERIAGMELLNKSLIRDAARQLELSDQEVARLDEDLKFMTDRNNSADLQALLIGSGYVTTEEELKEMEDKIIYGDIQARAILTKLLAIRDRQDQFNSRTASVPTGSIRPGEGLSRLPEGGLGLTGN